MEVGSREGKEGRRFSGSHKKHLAFANIRGARNLDDGHVPSEQKGYLSGIQMHLIILQAKACYIATSLDQTDQTLARDQVLHLCCMSY